MTQMIDSIERKYPFNDNIALFFFFYIIAIYPFLAMAMTTNIIPIIPLGIIVLIPFLVFFIDFYYDATIRYTQFDIYMGVLCSYILFVAIFSLPGYAEYAGIDDATRTMLLGEVYPIIIFLFFRSRRLWKRIFSIGKFVILFWLVCSVTYFGVSWWGTGVLGLPTDILSLSLRNLSPLVAAAGTSIRADDLPDVGYLAIGDTYALLSLLALTLCKSDKIKPLLGLIAIYVLYIIGSRSSMTFFTVTLTLWGLYSLRSSLHKLIIGLLVISACIGGVITYNDSITAEIDANQTTATMLGLLYGDIEEDASNSERQEFAVENRDYLMKSPVFGEYRFEEKERTRPGSYTHNIISFWEQYGIFAFLVLLFVFMGGMIAVGRKASKSPLAKYALWSAVFYGLSLLFARSYASVYIWYVLGVISAGLGVSAPETENSSDTGQRTC